MESELLLIIESLNPLVIIALLVWSLTWKGVALWSAARSGQKHWFVALLLINTLGLLEILYLYVLKKEVKKSGTNDVAA